MVVNILIGILAGGGIGGLLGYIGRCSSGSCPFSSTPIRGLFFGSIFGLLLALSYGCERNVDKVYDKNAIQGGLFIENTKDFEELVLKSPKPVVVNFFSPTCPPCRKLAPTIVSLKEKYSDFAEVYKVDVTKLPELASNYNIRSVPEVSFFVEGKEVERITGFNYESVYLKVIDKLKNELSHE